VKRKSYKTLHSKFKSKQSSIANVSEKVATELFYTI